LRSEERSVLLPFILSWNLRNVVEHPSSVVPKNFCITGTDLGEYPIDGWKALFIEIPENTQKKDIVGRYSHAFGIRMGNTEWNNRRIVELPIYVHCRNADLGRLKTVVRHWPDVFIQDDMPCLAVAAKCVGFYSDHREAQYVTVLAVWNDTTARIVSLDWIEGPLEDCVTPEWHVETTPLLNLRESLEKMETLYKHVNWDKTCYAIYTIPTCLGHRLQGKTAETPYAFWGHECGYDEYSLFNDDLNLTLSVVQDVFSNNIREVKERKIRRS